MALWFPALFHASKLDSPDICKELETVLEGGPAASLRHQCWGTRHGNNSRYSQVTGMPGRKELPRQSQGLSQRGQRRGDVGSWAYDAPNEGTGHQGVWSGKEENHNTVNKNQQQRSKKKRQKISKSQVVLFLFAKLILQLSL